MASFAQVKHASSAPGIDIAGRVGCGGTLYGGYAICGYAMVIGETAICVAASGGAAMEECTDEEVRIGECIDGGVGAVFATSAHAQAEFSVQNPHESVTVCSPSEDEGTLSTCFGCTGWAYFVRANFVTPPSLRSVGSGLGLFNGTASILTVGPLSIMSSECADFRGECGVAGCCFKPMVSHMQSSLEQSMQFSSSILLLSSLGLLSAGGTGDAVDCNSSALTGGASLLLP